MNLTKIHKVICSETVVCFCCLSSWVPLAHGQASIDGAITGMISDSSGAVVPGVAVTITNTATQRTQTVITNSNGFYAGEAVPPSTYDVSAKKEGFKVFISRGVRLNPGERLTLNVTLQVGETTSEITVQANPIQVETSSGETSGVISGDQIQQLLLNGRSYLGLALLVPGVNSGQRGAGKEIGYGGLTGTAASTLAVNGMGSESNLVTFDGAYNSNSGGKNNQNVNPALDSISEFRILKTNYSAKYGLTGSSQIQLQSKSGTQAFHGSAYEFLRNDALDASNFFAGINPATGKPNKTPLKQNNFGYSIGGPLYIPGKYNTDKKKTFFFVNQEWRRVRSGLTLRGAMIPQEMRNGDFTNSPTFLSAGGLKLDSVATQLMSQLHPGVNCLIDSSHLNPACFDQNAVKLMNKYWPLPNNPSGGFLNYINNGSGVVNQRDDTIRGDHYFSDKLSLTLRYNYETVSDSPPALTFGGNPAPTLGQTLSQTGFNNLARLTWNINPTTINQFSVAQTHDKPRGTPYNATLPSDVTIHHYYPLETADRGNNRIPQISIARGWAPLGVSPLPIDASNGEVTYSDDLTKVVRNHIIQAGALVIFGIKRQNIFANSNGSFTFSGVHTNDPVGDYLLGLNASYNQRSQDRKGYIRYRQFDLYIQDDWKVTPKLTLNLGVRQVYVSSFKVEDNNFSDFDPRLWNASKAPFVQPNGQFLLDASGNPLTATGTPADPLNGLVYAGQDGVPEGIYLTPKVNLEPRFGFAWDFLGDGKTVLRGGYGLGHSYIGFGAYSSLGNPPFVQSVTLLNGTLTDPVLGTPGAKTPQGLNFLGPPSARNPLPYVQTWNLTIERQIVRSGVFNVSYTGSGARLLHGNRDINFPLPVSAPSIANPACLDPGQTIPGDFNFDPCLNRGLVSGNFTRPLQGWANISTGGQDSNASGYLGTSNYHSLQAGFRYNTGRALTLTTSYTFGKVLSDVASRGDSGGGNHNVSAQNPRNYGAEYGRAGWDRTHVFSAGYIWELPIFRNRTDIVGQVLGGWQFSGITIIQSGLPFSPGNSVLAGLASRPNVVGAVSGPKTLEKWFNTDAFVRPAAGFFGSAGTGLIEGPGENTWNWAFFKNFSVRERAKIQFRAEFFNIWNHPNFLGLSTALGAANFGRVTSALDPRIIEFGLRLDF